MYYRLVLIYLTILTYTVFVETVILAPLLTISIVLKFSCRVVANIVLLKKLIVKALLLNDIAAYLKWINLIKYNTKP